MIHFVTVFSLEYDTDLMPFFCPYYARMNFDKYTAYLHTNSPLDKDFITDTEKFFQKYGFETILIYGPWSVKIKNSLYGAYVEKLPGNSYFWTADADEFQVLPDNIKTILETHDLIHGHHIDKWSRSLTKADNTRPLSDQYPITGNFEKDNSLANAFPQKRTKIIAAKAGIPVKYNGSHCIQESAATADLKRVGPFEIYHYKFRHCLISKMCERPYFTIPYINQYIEFFNVTHNDKFQARIALDRVPV